jgi:predicted sugar kinase
VVGVLDVGGFGVVVGVDVGGFGVVVGVDVGGLGVEVGGFGVVVGGYSVVYVVVLTVVVSPVVIVAVLVAVPDCNRLLQKSNASEVCPTNASRPHFSTGSLISIVLMGTMKHVMNEFLRTFMRRTSYHLAPCHRAAALRLLVHSHPRRGQLRR